jgi:hypothetical protein
MKKTLFWVLSFVITVLFAMFQRVTGPTYPAKGAFTSADGKVTGSYRFPRSCTTGTTDCLLEVELKGQLPSAALPVVKWRRYKTAAAWAEIPFSAQPGARGAGYSAVLPAQPPAGKLEYAVFLRTPAGDEMPGGGPLVTRFKGSVPAWALVPHIILMFLFLLFSTRIFLSVFSSGFAVKHALFLNLLFLLLGGFVFGPLVQYYAFGQAWTGFPFGYDLTDNKTLLMLLAWLPALYFVLKGRGARAWVTLAFVVTFAVYLVPHSLFGSELDYSRNQVVTGR